MNSSFSLKNKINEFIFVFSFFSSLFDFNKDFNYFSFFFFFYFSALFKNNEENLFKNKKNLKIFFFKVLFCMKQYTA